MVIVSVDKVHILVHTLVMNRITISLPDDVYNHLIGEVGKGKISGFVAESVRLSLVRRKMSEGSLDQIVGEIEQLRQKIGKVDFSVQEIKKLARKGLE